MRATSQFDKNILKFWISPSDNTPHEVDLTEFWIGRTVDHVDPRAKKIWGGDYVGRPEFALELRDFIVSERPRKDNIRSVLTSARNLFRFIDTLSSSRKLFSSNDFLDSDGIELQTWLSEDETSGSEYGRIKWLVDGLRQQAGHSVLFWPARLRARIIHKEDIDELGMKRLFLAFKKEGMEVKRMFREGESLAQIGQDPRGEARISGSAYWERRANHAWLIDKLTSNVLPYKEQFLELGGGGLNRANNPQTQKHYGPTYIAPGMTSRGSEGIVGKLRWFHPSYHDTAVYLWMFLLGTGWNLATALAVDFTNEWSEPHPQKELFQVVHAYKRRSERHQFALSMEKPEWHPYRILSFMKERTRALRQTVELRLQSEVVAAGACPLPHQAAEIERLRTISRSPWLYHVVNKIGEVNCFSNSDSARLNQISRIVAERHGLDKKHPSLVAMTTSEARDAWIGYAYASTNSNVLIARLAAQHADYRTLKHYLRRRRYRAQSEKTIRIVQNAIFDEIAERGILDPARLRILVQKGKITLEQEKRLLDHRKRTRLGMGCLDPIRPPSVVAPNHVEGSLCRVQRCTGCAHGVVFAESLGPLARSRAELIYLKRTLPLLAWTGSSLEDEERSVEATLSLFDADEVGAIVDAWLEKLFSGEVQPHDTYPVY